MNLAAPHTPEASSRIRPILTVRNVTVSDNCFFQVGVHIAEPNNPPCLALIDVIWFMGLPQPDILKAEIDGDEVSGTRIVTRHFDQLCAVLVAEFRKHVVANA